MASPRWGGPKTGVGAVMGMGVVTVVAVAGIGVLAEIVVVAVRVVVGVGTGVVAVRASGRRRSEWLGNARRRTKEGGRGGENQIQQQERLRQHRDQQHCFDHRPKDGGDQKLLEVELNRHWGQEREEERQHWDREGLVGEQRR